MCRMTTSEQPGRPRRVTPDPVTASGTPGDGGDGGTPVRMPSAEDDDFDWRKFLTRWSSEWADATDPVKARERGLGEAQERRWLGFAPAEPVAVAALEARSGRPLPPSFLAFLEVSDGWRETSSSVWLMARTELTQIHGDPAGLAAIWAEDADPEDEEALREAKVWERSLQLAHESDAVDVLLDPLDVDEDGEWAVRVWAPWYGSEPDRFPSFRAYMVAAYEKFLGSTARDDPRFANATTDALDSQVERARCLALAGAPDDALTLLEPAARAGRPRAIAIQHQLRAMLLGPHGAPALPMDLGDRDWAVRELLPVTCLHLARVDYSGEGPDQALLLRAFPRAGAGRIESVSRAVFDGTYQHGVQGPFGAAVVKARELARWGAVDEAWAVLCEGMREWHPYDELEHVAPLGLKADGILGPLLTPRRARELLSVPRAGAESEHLSDDAGTSHDDTTRDGLSWLVDRSRAFGGWWLVLARGAEPMDLPHILGTDSSLSPHPVTAGDRRKRAFPPGPAPRRIEGQPGRLSAPAVVWNGNASAAAVGRAGTGPEGRGWAFAQVGQAARGPRRSPAPSASAISNDLVLSLAGSWHLEPDAPVLHVTAAEAGRTLWEVSVGPTGHYEPTVRGDVPTALDPRHLPAARALDPSGPAQWLCEALAAEFRVTVCQDAVVFGRLHSLDVPVC